MQVGPLATSIVHTTDFSAMSERAFNHSLSLALRLHASLTIAHVSAAPPADTHWAQFPAVRDTLQRWELLTSNSQRTDVADKLGIQVEKVDIQNRTLLKPIINLIEKRAAELIVLATHGRDGSPRGLHPSVAEPIARTSRVQTLFVPDKAVGFVDWRSGLLNLRRILLPVDTTPDPLFALRAAVQIARLSDTQESVEITVLHIGESNITAIPETLQQQPIDWKMQSLSGDVISTITHTASTMRADLIVMPTRGHHGFLDALRGSTTEQVLRQAICPLLAVPAA